VVASQFAWPIETIAGWWLTYPFEKYESHLGLLFPIYGTIKAMFQTTNQFNMIISAMVFQNQSGHCFKSRSLMVKHKYFAFSHGRKTRKSA